MHDLLTTSTDQVIGGNFTLQGRVKLNELNVSGYLNQYDIGPLIDQAVRLTSGPQQLSSRLEFDRLVVLEDVVVDGSVNDVGTELFVRDGVDQNFTAPQVLVRPIFGNLDVGGSMELDETIRINELDVGDWHQRRVTLSTDQNLTGHWVVDRADFGTARFDQINGLSSAQWTDDFVHRMTGVLDAHQTISGP